MSVIDCVRRLPILIIFSAFCVAYLEAMFALTSMITIQF